jgi:hypothetical protein
MKRWLAGLAAFACLFRFAQAADVGLPPRDVDLIKAADVIHVVGTNDLGGDESFTIHDRKAIGQFVGYLTDNRFTPVPKSLNPKFKSRSAYMVTVQANGAPTLKLVIIGDSILDIPGDPMFYMESESYSENLMAPLLRLRE